MKNNFHIKSEINMVPFIDICLVLLVILMGLGPFIKKQYGSIKVNIPYVESMLKEVQTQKNDINLVNIQLTKEKSIYIDDKKISLDELVSVLKTQLKGKNKSVMIEADKNIPIKDIVVIMNKVKINGGTKVGIKVLKK